MVELKPAVPCLSCGAAGPDYCTAPAGVTCSFYERLIAELEARAEKAEADCSALQRAIMDAEPQAGLSTAFFVEAAKLLHDALAGAQTELARLRAAGTFNQGVEAAIAWHEAGIKDDEKQIAENDAYLLKTGRHPNESEGNVFCRRSIGEHRLSIIGLRSLRRPDSEEGG